MHHMTKNRRWVLVTGGSRGIGRGVTKALVGSGFDVVFTFKNSSDEALSLELEFPGHVRGCRCDGADADAIGALVGDLLREYGAPYALINNMGITRDVPLIQMSRDQWDDVCSNNLDSMFHFSRSIAPAMIEQGEGVIIQMSSVAAIRGNIGQTNYGATKAAMIGFTKSLALELGRFNIRVNAIAPGFIDTQMLASLPEATRRQLSKTIPLRRFGQVGEVGSLVAFLLSEAATYITGQMLVIDGGLTA